MFRKLISITLFLLFTIHYPLSTIHATIIQKVLIVNPSKELTRTIPVKVYLPKEAKPENIMDAGGFEISYDFNSGQYVGTQDVTLSPGESVTKMIEIADVWAMKKEEVGNLESSINKTVDKLKDSEAYQQAKGMQAEIKKTIGEVRELQGKSFASPDEQIAAYRDAQLKLREIEAQLSRIGNLVVQEAGPDLFGGGHVTIKTIWRIIIGVIVLLGVLSLVFFAVWQNQLAKMPKEENESPVGSEGGFEYKDKEGESR
ncbi:MAG: hypothetical protein ABII25_03155 [bacterium]